MTSKYLNQTREEEIANTISHGISFLLSIAGLVILIVFSSMNFDFTKLLTSIAYGISLMFLFLMSTLSHGIMSEKPKKFFQVMDYIAIYFLIAGTYTPVLLIGLNNTIGWVLFGVNWGIVIFGIIYKIFFTGKQELVSNVLYLAMGWTGILVMNQLLDNISVRFVYFCVIGGVLYSIGLIFYLATKLKYHHLIWHLFVLAGSLMMYFGILFDLVLG